MKRDKAKLRFGVVGCGGAAGAGHAAWFRFLPRARLVAACDTDKAKAEAFARRFGIDEAYADLDEMLGRARLDAVLVATPSWAHAGPTVKSLAAGVHVFCEKPMALEVDDADRMLEAARSADRALMIGFQKRYNPGHEQARRLILDGALGRVISARYEYYGAPPNGNNPRLQAAASALERLGMEPGLLRNRWTGAPARPGFGVFSELGAHGVDFLQWCLGPVESVTAAGVRVSRELSFEDNASALLTFGSGAAAVVEVSYARVSYGERELIEFHGERGNLTLHGGGFAHLLPARVRLQRAGLLGLWRDVTPRGVFAPAAVRKYQYLIQRIEGSPGADDPGACGAHGRAAVRVVSAFYSALESGLRVRLDPTHP